MQIMSFLHASDLLTVAQVSKRWQRASEDHRLWRDICLRELTPDMPAAEIVVPDRNYKALWKTEWLIRKWKQSHRPRKPLVSAETQAKEEYRQLNFQFEEKLISLREMVSYKMVFLLRLSNSPLIDYLTFGLWLLLTIFLMLRLDGVIRWKWAAALWAIWPLALTFMAATATWWYFFVRRLISKDFSERCLFGWINVLACCFSDDLTEANLWFSVAICVSLLPVTLVSYLDGLLPRLWPGSPWIGLLPAGASALVFAAMFVRSAVIKPGPIRGVKITLASISFSACVFFAFIAARAQGLLSWNPWKLFSPLWAVDGLGIVTAFTFCDPLFFRRDGWFRSGLVMVLLVVLLLSPFFTTQVLLCIRIAQASSKVRHYSAALSPILILIVVSIIVLLVGDFHLWPRIKHFWVIKRSFKWPLREHWRKSDSVVVLD